MEKYAAEHILGLSGEYDAHTLKTAYRELASIHHPDAAEAHGIDPQTATAKMQEINEANDYLVAILAKWGPTVSCEQEPARPEDPEKRGVSWAPPVSRPDAAYNPFEGHRSGAADRRRRQSTAQYYWSDPRYQSRGERRTEPRPQSRPVFRNGEYESFSGAFQPDPVEDPARPFPTWYLPLWHFFAVFPYRFLLLLAACLLVSLSDPLGASRHIGFMSFDDLLILVALINLVKPFLTAPIRFACLWLVDRLRDLAWIIRGI